MGVHFEDMKKDLAKEIKRISDFLCLERSDEEIAKVTERCTFTSMKTESKKRIISDREKLVDGLMSCHLRLFLHSIRTLKNYILNALSASRRKLTKNTRTWTNFPV